MFRNIFIASFTILSSFAAVLPCAAVPGADAPASQPVKVKQQRSLPLLFTENRGQVADANGKLRPDILFSAQSGATALYLTGNAIYYQFNKITYPKGYQPDEENPVASAKQFKKETYRFSVTLAGANLHPKVRKEEQKILTENFYLAHCPNGITGVRTFAKLVYEDVYPGIDWVLYSNGKSLKYDFLVHPGSDPAQIKLKISDAQSVRITGSGELLMKTALGDLREAAPVSYSEDKEIKSAFRQNGDGTIGFDVARQEDKELRIDPAVTWATYYGGSGSEAPFLTAGGTNVMGLAVDASGNSYSAGTTTSASGIATSGGHQAVFGNSSTSYLAKFDPSGNILWATYYGGGGTNAPNCAVDNSGNVYLTGLGNPTYVYATPGAHQTSNAGSSSPDVFLVKFNSSGIRLWGTYYGGTLQEGAAFCATDPSGNVYLCGTTQASATGIATPGAFMTAPASLTGSPVDAFLVKFDAAGTRLWGTYYGGIGQETGTRCVTDNAGNVYLAGITNSTAAIATPGAAQPAFGGGTNDAFLVKFDGSGARLWATYYGGPAADQAFLCTTDNSDNVYLSGVTASASGIATAGAHQTTAGGGNDNFIAKFTPAGARTWGTYYGGSAGEGGGYCSVDNLNNVFLTGTTASAAGIASSGFQNIPAGANDAYLAKFDSTGLRQWGTYYGGPGNDQGFNCASDRQGSVYITGTTTSTTGIATTGAHQNALAGSTDAFLVKVVDATITTDSTLSGSPFCAGASVNVPFTIQGSFSSFAAGNSFTAQLSDASGSFASPVNIGTLNGTVAGTINSTIPLGTATGAGYRIRVVSSSPAMTGTDNKVNLLINASVIPAVAIAANPGNNICAGTSVTFTATPVNGGANPSYQWKKNSVNVGTNQNSYTDNALANGDMITVVLTSDAACAAPLTANSAAIAMTVNPNLVPSVTIAANPGDSICSGTSVIFTASEVNGGAAPSYQWKKNGVNAGSNQNTYTDNALANGDVVTIALTSNALCAVPANAVSNGITMKVNPPVVPSVTISASTPTTICSGTSVTFTATPVNGGTAPVYQWKKNNVSVGINQNTYTDAALANGDVITVTMTSNAPCATPALTTGNVITMTVSSTLTPSVSITQSPAGLVCAATSVTFTAVPVNGGATPLYQWQKNGLNIAGATSATYTASSWVNGDQLTVSITSNAACLSNPVATSNIITLTVTPPPGSFGSLTGSSAVCAGTSQSYSIGSVPNAISYTWTLPSGWSGTSAANSITAIAGSNSGTISVTASNACGTSTPASLAVTVNPVTTPSVTVSASTSTTICAGTSVTFTATPVNGGASPVYQWRNNGVSIPGANAGTYTTAGLVTGDVIDVIMTTGLPCSTTATVTSNTLAFTVNSIPAQPGPVLGSTTVCNGTAQSYSVAGIPGASSFTWTFPAGWSGAGNSNNINVTAGDSSGIITVSASNSCGTSTVRTLAVTVNSIPAQPAAITGPLAPCTGSSVAYSITPVGGATSYNWALPTGWTGGGTSAAITVAAGSSAGNVSVSAANVCGTSTPSSIAVSPIGLPSAPSAISGSISVCSGTVQVYAVTPVNGLTYNWTAPAGWAGISNTPSISYTTGSNSGNITVTATGICGTGPASVLFVTAAPTVTPSLSINTATTSVCAGALTTFTAIAVNGGPNPQYQWKKNGSNVGGNAATYTDNNLITGDVITATLTSVAACVTSSTAASNAIALTVLPSVVPGININATTPPDICQGTPVTFFSNITAGGNAPSYSWRKNGLVVGNNASFYTDNNLRSGDTVYSILTSNAACATVTSVSSNKMGVIVAQPMVPSVAMTVLPGTNVSPGQPVLFSATAVNGGANPSFQWMKNNQAVGGADDATWTTTNLATGDVITVNMTSDAPCAFPVQVTGNRVVMTVGAATGINAQSAAYPAVRLYPNPNTGRFTLEVSEDAGPAGAEQVQILIVNALGQTVYKSAVTPNTKKWSLDITLGAEIANGIYTLRIGNELSRGAQRFELKR